MDKNRESDIRRLLMGGGVELLRPDEVSKVGWLPISEGYGGIHNPKGYAALRVVVKKYYEDLTTFRENGEPVILSNFVYDQVMLVENAGAVVICELDGKFGLIKNLRFTGPRYKTDYHDYVHALESEGKWKKMVDSLGEVSWELPAGIAQSKRDETLKEAIIRIARIEASEEAGFELEDVVPIGLANFNPTFFAHSQYIVRAKVSLQREQRTEQEEFIGPVKFFTVEEIRELINKGELKDGKTLTAFALAGIQIPFQRPPARFFKGL
jgi:8-oxo-dGTP pyrophosphatase MutT (NUDIX family)